MGAQQSSPSALDGTAFSGWNRAFSEPIKQTQSDESIKYCKHEWNIIEGASGNINVYYVCLKCLEHRVVDLSRLKSE